MKKLLLICSIILLGNTTTNATALNAGDIAISSINSDVNDDFSFVLLTSISGTTTIYFTDNGWDDDANGAFANPTWRSTSEGTITWTYSGNLPCGTEIQISNPSATVSTNQGSASKTGSFNISSTADHLLAYTGTSEPLDGTEITNFITAFGLGTNGWSSDASSTTTSALPPGLTDGVDAIATENGADNFQYNCATLSPVAALSTALVTLANFTSGNSNENYQGPACAYSCGVVCTDPDVPSLLIATPATICSDSSTTLSWTGNLNDATQWVIYSASCGGTSEGTSTTNSFIVMPGTANTSYFIRGEGGCVTPGSCGTVMVTVNLRPATPTGTGATICSGETDTLRATSSGGTLEWYSEPALTNLVASGNSFITPSLTSNTDYYVIEKDGNGCQSDIETVSAILLSALTGTNTTTICANDSVVINVTTYNAANPTGTEVFENVSANGCDSTVTINLNVLSALTGTNNTTICANDSVVINGTTYNAANPTGTEVFSNIGSNNCDSTVTVALNVLPELTGTNNTTICANDSVVINGTTYNAVNPTGIEVFENVSANGCDSTVTVNLTVLPAIDITVTNSAPTLSANATSATYQWLDCANGDTAIIGATNSSYTVTTNGSYAAVVTQNGCTDTSACISVTVTGLTNASLSTDNYNVYPNPTKGIFTIDVPEVKKNTSIAVYDMLGKVIVSKNATSTTTKIDLSGNTKGVYFINIQFEDEKIVRKVILQ